MVKTRRHSRRSRFSIGFGLVLFGVIPSLGQDRVLVSTEHSGSKATVMIIDGDATLRLESAGAAARVVPLGNDWKGVSLVRFSPSGSRIAIIGNAATAHVSIVDVPSARIVATYPIAAAAVSPDGRAVILEHLRNAQAPSKARFSLVPLTGPAVDIHTDDRNSVRQSDFQWTDPEVVAFIELVGNEARVVALQVDTSGRVQKRAEKSLPVNEWVDTALVKDGAPAKAIAGAEISRIPSAGLTVRLEFPANPALRRRTAEVRLWE